MDSDLSEEVLVIFCGKCDPTQLGIVLNLCWKQDIFTFASPLSMPFFAQLC